MYVCSASMHMNRKVMKYNDYWSWYVCVCMLCQDILQNQSCDIESINKVNWWVGMGHASFAWVCTGSRVKGHHCSNLIVNVHNPQSSMLGATKIVDRRTSEFWNVDRAVSYMLNLGKRVCAESQRRGWWGWGRNGNGSRNGCAYGLRRLWDI